MSWRDRSPRVDDRRHRSTESCGKGHGLDPLLNNACNNGHSIGSYPYRMIRRGEDIETKWFSGRSTTPIRSKGAGKKNVRDFLYDYNKSIKHNHRVVDGTAW